MAIALSFGKDAPAKRRGAWNDSIPITFRAKEGYKSRFVILNTGVQQYFFQDLIGGQIGIIGMFVCRREGLQESRDRFFYNMIF